MQKARVIIKNLWTKVNYLRAILVVMVLVIIALSVGMCFTTRYASRQYEVAARQYEVAVRNFRREVEEIYGARAIAYLMLTQFYASIENINPYLFNEAAHLQMLGSLDGHQLNLQRLAGSVGRFHSFVPHSPIDIHWEAGLPFTLLSLDIQYYEIDVINFYNRLQELVGSIINVFRAHPVYSMHEHEWHYERGRSRYRLMEEETLRTLHDLNAFYNDYILHFDTWTGKRASFFSYPILIRERIPIQ